PMSSGANPAIRFRTRGPAGRMRRLPFTTWFDQPQNARAERREPLFEVSRPGAEAARGNLHRERSSCGAIATGHLLDFRVPYRRAWIERPSTDVVLRDEFRFAHLRRRCESFCPAPRLVVFFRVRRNAIIWCRLPRSI